MGVHLAKRVRNRCCKSYCSFIVESKRYLTHSMIQILQLRNACVELDLVLISFSFTVHAWVFECFSNRCSEVGKVSSPAVSNWETKNYKVRISSMKKNVKQRPGCETWPWKGRSVAQCRIPQRDILNEMALVKKIIDWKWYDNDTEFGALT